MQTPQLIPYLLQHQSAREIYYKLLSLPLLPPSDILQQFKKLKVLALANHKTVFADFIKYYENQWIKKEGPEKISVFNKWTRTTGALEAYNGVLGRKIIGRSHFFKFIKVLLDEEYRKCRDFHSLLRGRDDKTNHRSNKFQVRGEKIMKNSKLLLEKRLNADQFLDRIVYQQSSDDFGMLDTTLINAFIDHDDDENVLDEEIGRIPSPTPSSQSSQSSASSRSLGQCALCEAEPELLLLPCFEYCVCQTCWDILKNNHTKPACPSCKSTVNDAKKN